MGIIKTGDAFKSLTFDGEDSRNYGIYITGNAVYNAPERDVEMIEIPGRNGAFALDNGRFQNIEVTYPAGIFADNESDFADGISAFRNFLCSRKGYVRLTDEYNPDEYRLAVYKSGLEVSPAQLKAGEFDITFECKPQRFLLSGENEITVESGDTIDNPTLFESNPLLISEGLGAINVGDSKVTINDLPLGRITLRNSGSFSGDIIPLNGTDNLNYMDNINVGTVTIVFRYTSSTAEITSVSLSPVRNCTGTWVRESKKEIQINLKMSPIVFEAGVESGEISSELTGRFDFSSGSWSNVQFEGELSYDGAYGIQVGWDTDSWLAAKISARADEITADSTKSVLPETIYTDLDIGEAYYLNDGTPVPLNNTVEIPAKLPTLAPGENEITYDNTITSLKLVPRWWKV